MNRFIQFQVRSIRIVPGMGVFNFTPTLNPLQPVSSCIEIQVKSVDGSVKVFNDFQCPLHKDKYSILQDPSRIFYMNLASTAKLGVEPTESESLPVLATAEYFCRKFDGRTAIIRYPVHYQNLVNGVVMAGTALPHVIDCAILRPRHAPS